MDKIRPTKTIKTPIGGEEVVLKSWITGRELEYISEPMYDMVKAEAKIGVAPQVSTGNIAQQMTESAHRTISTVVVSINGSIENILDSVLDMVKDDYEFIMEEIEAITKKKEAPTKP